MSLISHKIKNIILRVLSADASGNVKANVVPRHDTLDNLLAEPSAADGEVATSSDIPAKVIFNTVTNHRYPMADFVNVQTPPLTIWSTSPDYIGDIAGPDFEEWVDYPANRISNDVFDLARNYTSAEPWFFFPKIVTDGIAIGNYSTYAIIEIAIPAMLAPIPIPADSSLQVQFMTSTDGGTVWVKSGGGSGSYGGSPLSMRIADGVETQKRFGLVALNPNSNETALWKIQMSMPGATEAWAAFPLISVQFAIQSVESKVI